MRTKPGTKHKIKSMLELADEVKRLKSGGKSTVQCHGVFDLVHLGHIRHFEEAAEQGDCLIVTLTADEFVNKGPGRPEFTAELRAEMVASIGIVDYVAINDAPTAVTALTSIQPDVYVKGPDYQDQSDDRSGGIGEEQSAVEAHGGRLYITSGETNSSTKLLNDHFDRLPKETRGVLDQIRGVHSSDSMIDYLERASELSVLVIGDTIVDEYQYCSAIGKSSKGPTLAVQLESSESSLGGGMAIANHLANFANKTSVLSTVGDDDLGREFVPANLDSKIDRAYIMQKNRRTIVKRRVIERYFFQKLLEIYEIDDAPTTGEEEVDIIEQVERLAPQFDVVIVADFGHGLITPAIARAIERSAKYLALNVQMNAGNLGYNTVSKYKRADYVSITESELRLDFRDKHVGLDAMVSETMTNLGATRFTVTQGASGCTVYSSSDQPETIPAFASEVVDRVGAGDAVLAVTSLVSALDAPPQVIGFIGNVVGAEAVGIVGNETSVQRLQVLRSIESLLK